MSTSLFRFTEKMVFTTVDAETKRLTTFIHQLNSPTLLLDVSAIIRCDSAGMALLIESKRLAQKYKKKCQIIGMTSRLEELAQFYGLVPVLI
jgi:ABC-type transporter Mla MlaB component